MMPTEHTPRTPHSGRHSSEDWLLSLVQQMVIGILDERDRRYQERFEAQQQALGKVEQATEKRFESVNEFRKAMGDRDILYMPRAEAMSQYTSILEKIDGHAREDLGTHSAMNQRIEAVGKRVDNFDGTITGSRTTLITIAGLATFLVAAIVIGSFVFAGKQTPTPSQVIYVPAPAGSMLPTTPPQAAPR